MCAFARCGGCQTVGLRKEGGLLPADSVDGVDSMGGVDTVHLAGRPTECACPAGISVYACCTHVHSMCVMRCAAMRTFGRAPVQMHSLSYCTRAPSEVPTSCTRECMHPRMHAGRHQAAARPGCHHCHGPYGLGNPRQQLADTMNVSCASSEGRAQRTLARSPRAPHACMVLPQSPWHACQCVSQLH